MSHHVLFALVFFVFPQQNSGPGRLTGSYIHASSVNMLLVLSGSFSEQVLFLTAFVVSLLGDESKIGTNFKESDDSSGHTAGNAWAAVGVFCHDHHCVLLSIRPPPAETV